MSVTTLNDYARSANEVAETWIGELCWYSLHDISVPYTLFAGTLAGFPDLDLPGAPADHDVFRRACSKQKANRVPGQNDGEFYNYMMREFADGSQIVRRVVRETVNSKGKRLHYDEMIDISFRRPAQKGDAPGVRIKPIPGVVADGTATEMVNAALREYNAKRGTLNAQGVREWMRKYLVDAGAVKTPGGPYFISQAKAGVLAVLEVLTDAVNNDLGAGTIEYHSLPLIDTTRQRSMIRRAFEAETSNAIDSKMTEIRSILEKGKVSEKRFTDILGEYQRLVGRTTEYKDVLDTALSDTETRLEWFKAQVLSLSNIVDYGDES